jgi:hypothetical protein
MHLLLHCSRPTARYVVRRLGAGRGSLVPGLLNAVAAWSMRFVPRALAARTAYLTMKQPGDTLKTLQARG